MNCPTALEGNEYAHKLRVVCYLLDDKIEVRTQAERNEVAEMYMLAANYIHHQLNYISVEMSQSEELLFQLSGFKRPLEALLTYAKANNCQQTRDALADFSRHFVNRHRALQIRLV